MSLKIFLLKNFFEFYAWFDPGYCILHYYNDQNIFKKAKQLWKQQQQKKTQNVTSQARDAPNTHELQKFSHWGEQIYST